MLDRISTASSYSSMLSNLMQAEVAQTNAGNQLSTNETATDLEGYGAGAETLTALQSTTTQVTGYLNNTQVVGAKLSTQDNALGEVAGSATSAISAITNALATGNANSLMSSLEDAFGSAVEGLNTTFNGEYLFAGGQVNTQPVTATNLASLAAAPSVASVFQNDQRVAATQVDPTTSISTGFLASDVGTPLFQALQAIQTYAAGPNGPLTGSLTTAQSTFLTAQISNLNSVQTALTNVVAQNGESQTEVTNAQTSLTSQQSMLQGLVGNLTSPNLAQASANLQQAQLSIQAAGQVFQALNNSSLLSSLSAVPSLG